MGERRVESGEAELNRQLRSQGVVHRIGEMSRARHTFLAFDHVFDERRRIIQTAERRAQRDTTAVAGYPGRQSGQTATRGRQEGSLKSAQPAIHR